MFRVRARSLEVVPRTFANAWPALAVAAGSVAVLLAFAGQYGLHRDEMYFVVAGRHPDWGYVDQPPLTPLLNALSAALFGMSTFGIRVLPAFAFGAAVLVAAAIAREFGGGRRAQAIAALTLAVSGYLDAGHMNTTATYDVLGWSVVLLFVVRLLRGTDRREWILAGIAAGITLQNKNLLVFLGLAMALAVLLTRRWDLIRNRWMWLGLGVAMIIWAPNLVWQAANGWPQLEMAKVIAARSGDENRSSLVLLQVVFAGPILFPISIAGIWWLLRSPMAVAWRPIGWAYLIILVLLFLTSGKGYYSGGMIPTLIAAGAVVVDGWLGRGRGAIRRAKAASYVAATAASAAMIVPLALPIVPVADLPNSPVPAINKDVGNTVGWDRYVAQVTTVVDGLTPAEKAHTAILTVNYGEAGALELFGRADLPPVYSGHNSYWQWGPPGDDRTVTVLIMHWDEAGSHWGRYLGQCERAATIDMGLKEEMNEEQGAGVWVCRGRTTAWPEIWAAFRNIG